MADSETLAAPVVGPPTPPDDKWRREYHAFIRLLPSLLVTHPNQFVAIHDGRVVGSGSDRIAVALEAYRKYGYVPMYVGHVTEQRARPVQPRRL